MHQRGKRSTEEVEVFEDTQKTQIENHAHHQKAFSHFGVIGFMNLEAAEVVDNR